MNEAMRRIGRPNYADPDVGKRLFAELAAAQRQGRDTQLLKEQRNRYMSRQAEIRTATSPYQYTSIGTGKFGQEALGTIVGRMMAKYGFTEDEALKQMLDDGMIEYQLGNP